MSETKTVHYVIESATKIVVACIGASAVIWGILAPMGVYCDSYGYGCSVRSDYIVYMYYPPELGRDDQDIDRNEAIRDKMSERLRKAGYNVRPEPSADHPPFADSLKTGRKTRASRDSIPIGYYHPSRDGQKSVEAEASAVQIQNILRDKYPKITFPLIAHQAIGHEKHLTIYLNF